MSEKKTRIETDAAPASTGFRSQGLIAGGILFTAGQIGSEMMGPDDVREPSEDMGEAVGITLGHLEQVTLAAGLTRKDVFEVSAFPRVKDQKDLVYAETQAFLGAEPNLFTFHEVFDVAAHALLEMDWMALADESLSRQEAADWMRPLSAGPQGEAIESGPFLIWNGLKGHGDDLGLASEALLADLQQRLLAQECTLDALVKMTVYIHAFDPYPMFNDVTQRYFADVTPPARSVLVAPEVTGDAKISIDVVALKA